MIARALGGAICAVLLSVPCGAQTVRTIINSGPTSNRYDVVILGDGYQAHEQNKFDQDCLRFSADLFRKEPYATFAGYFNVHTVFRASRESGADHPDASPPIVRDTVYDASYNTGGTARCLYIKNTGQALADAALAPATEGRILVMVNDTRYGGCAGTFAVSYTGSQMSEVQIHEMGHSVGRLADEYDYPNTTYTGGEPREPNVTKSSVGSKWSEWHGFGGISAFEGARYYRLGLFRPRFDCLMRTLNQTLCAVCAENIVLETHRRAGAIDAAMPATASVSILRPASQAFSFTSIAPPSSSTEISWKLDGETMATGVASYTLPSGILAAGSHKLVLEVKTSTPIVRRDPGGLLVQERSWDLTISGGTPGPDLELAAFSTVQSTAQAGSTIDINTMVLNSGDAGAGAFQVEHFLSVDPLITADDIYLGGYGVATLPASGLTNSLRAGVQLPASLPPGTYYTGVIVDREDRIAELREDNNRAWSPIQVTRAACGRVLEFVDPLVYPFDDARLSIGQAGAELHPTVVSPCEVGSTYVIVWGCSGTSPGTTVPGGVTAPLNLDVCSEISLMLQNSAYFAGFFGTLDADGVGRGTFRLTGLPYVGDIPGHFAALVLDPPATTFTGATNPVRVTVVR